MKHIISYSGGVGSAMAASLVVRKHGPDNCVLLFADTLVEDEDLYRFNSDIERVLGVKITTISAGMTPWQVFEKEKFIGNSRIDPCSKYLKRELIRKHLKDNYKPEECYVYVGIDCLEEHRLPRIIENNKPFRYRSPLIEQDVCVLPETKADFCKSLSIDPPRLYALGFAHNNCGGFCVKPGLAQFKALYENFPQRYKYNEDEEQRVMKANPKLRPFLRKTINRKLTYVTMKEYREKYLEAGLANTEEDRLSFGGCGCGV